MKINPRPRVPAFISLAASMVLAVALLVGYAAADPVDVDPTCEGSLQDLIDDTAPRAKVEAAGGCIYREAVTIRKPIILNASSGARRSAVRRSGTTPCGRSGAPRGYPAKPCRPWPPTASGNASPTRGGAAGPSKSSSTAGSSRRWRRGPRRTGDSSRSTPVAG
jgi:hypothetical protein